MKRARFFLAVAVVVCFLLSVAGCMGAEKVSIGNIIANPSQYQNKVVKVYGKTQGWVKCGDTNIDYEYTFKIRDNSGEITIFTNNKKIVDDNVKMTVTGTVYNDATAGVFIAQGADGPWADLLKNPLFYAVIGLVLVGVVLGYKVTQGGRQDESDPYEDITGPVVIEPEFCPTHGKPMPYGICPDCDRGPGNGAVDPVGGDENGVTGIILPPKEKAFLLFKAGSRAGQSQPISRPVNTIGRAGENTITVNDDGISRHHAQIVYKADDKSFHVYDMGSTNGTYVNGNKVDGGGALLNDGDEIQISDTVIKFAK